MLTFDYLSKVAKFRQAYEGFEPETEVTRHFNSKPTLVYDPESNRYRETKTGRYVGVIQRKIKISGTRTAKILFRKDNLEAKATS